jgi:DNA-binding transcriptional LysR family regulator
VELEGSDRQADLLQRAADIAVRMADPVQQNLLATRIGEVELGLFAAPAYIARRGPIEGLDRLEGHLLIGFARETPAIRAYTATLPMPPRETFGLLTDESLVSIGALRAGLGAGFCQVGIARREGWVRMLPALSLRLPMWVVMHEDLKANPACRAAFDALAAGMRAYVNSQRS